MKQVASNKSNSLLKNILQNTQTLKQFTKVIKTESIYESNLNANLNALNDEAKWS